MPQVLIFAVIVLVIGSIALGVTMLIKGRDPGLVPVEPDGYAVPLPGRRPLTERDIADIRFDVAPRGYRMAQVDRALDRAAYDIGYKSELIGVLEAEVDALRDGRIEDADALRQARLAAVAPVAERGAPAGPNAVASTGADAGPGADAAPGAVGAAGADAGAERATTPGQDTPVDRELPDQEATADRQITGQEAAEAGPGRDAAVAEVGDSGAAVVGAAAGPDRTAVAGAAAGPDGTAAGNVADPDLPDVDDRAQQEVAAREAAGKDRAADGSAVADSTVRTAGR